MYAEGSIHPVREMRSGIDCSFGRGILSGRDAMLIILIEEKQVRINKMQMRVRHIDLRVQGGQSLGGQRIMRCREDRWIELTRKTG